MPQFFEGKLEAKGLKFGIIVSRFNSFISERLLEGAVDALVRHGGDDKNIHVARVPGAFEIPLAAKKLAESGKYDAVICLSCVIRGDTPHFDYVAGEAAKGVAHISIETGVPVAFGVLTVDTAEQAEARVDKGADAARAALEMADLFSQVRKQARA